METDPHETPARAASWPVTTPAAPGLHDVVATFTRVAEHEPERGVVRYRGRPLGELLASSDAEEVAFLLLRGSLAAEAPAEWRVFGQSLRAHWSVSDASARIIERMTRASGPRTTPLDVLRAALSGAGRSSLWRSPVSTDGSPALLGQVLALAAATARAWGRSATGAPAASEARAPASSPRALSRHLLHAVSMRSDDVAETVFDGLLVLLADDGLSPPAFTALVVASCLADAESALVGAISAALGGATTGGAIGDWDPRTAAITAWAIRLGESGSPRTGAHESAVAPHASWADAAAPIFRGLGVSPELAPLVVACAGLAGALARLAEYQAENRLFRPLERYVGAAERSLPAVPRS